MTVAGYTRPEFGHNGGRFSDEGSGWTCRACHRGGARPGMRNREHLERAVGEITAADGTAYAASFDVTDDEAVTSAIGDAVRVHGRLDVLINNVGIRDRRGLFEFTLEDVRRLVNANLIAPFHIAREAARWMIKRGEGGRIVNISSIGRALGPRSDAAYTAAKAGLEGLT